MRSGTGVRYSRKLKMHWSWSLYLAFTLIPFSVGMYFLDHRAGLAATAFTAAYFLAILFVYFYYRPRILRAIVRFASRYGTVQAQVLKQLEIAAAIVDKDGNVLWMNDKLCELTNKPTWYQRNIMTIFPYLSKAVFPDADEFKNIDLTYEDRQLRAHLQRIPLDNLIADSELIETVDREDGSEVYMIYFVDETELQELRKQNREQRGVVTLIYLDNYDEAMDDVDEVHSSLMNVLIDREINKYCLAHNALSKKLEKDKYLVIMNQKSLEQAIADHFSVLEEVKTIHIGNEIEMTISVGVGAGGDDYNHNYDLAHSSIEMALGRGGDQAVVNRNGHMQFFGGKSAGGERHTRVKARVKAQAMREIMEGAARVLAMGHKLTDMDSLGAAIGIYRAAKTIGKPAWIVIGEDSTSIRGWLQMLRDSHEYDEDIFISPEKALEMCDNKTALFVVDTARRNRVECEELLEKTRTLVVLDHHRQTTEQIQNAALSYIEPSASSASEMVAEVLQYFEENVRLKYLEADCMYAGIIIDTNNFVAKTGARTFEAAAYLRRSGADVVRVRKMLREDMDSYKARAEAVRHAENYMGCYAISILPSEGLATPNVVGAQAANELLNIVGVRASFVVTEYGGRVFISARAIDEVNVQVIMERLGGGGHMNIAGAQLTGITCEEAVEKVKETLLAMTQAEEI